MPEKSDNPEAPFAPDVFGNLLGLLNRLSAARIPYTLRHSRADAVMIEVAVPGERWEIDFLEDGDVEVEVFLSGGNVAVDGGQIDQLFATHGE